LIATESIAAYCGHSIKSRLFCSDSGRQERKFEKGTDVQSIKHAGTECEGLRKTMNRSTTVCTALPARRGRRRL